MIYRKGQSTKGLREIEAGEGQRAEVKDKKTNQKKQQESKI